MRNKKIAIAVLLAVIFVIIAAFLLRAKTIDEVIEESADVTSGYNVVSIERLSTDGEMDIVDISDQGDIREAFDETKVRYLKKESSTKYNNEVYTVGIETEGDYLTLSASDIGEVHINQTGKSYRVVDGGIYQVLKNAYENQK